MGGKAMGRLNEGRLPLDDTHYSLFFLSLNRLFIIKQPYRRKLPRRSAHRLLQPEKCQIIPVA